MLFLLPRSPSYMPGSCIVACTPRCLIFCEGHTVNTYLNFSEKATVFNTRGLGVSLLEQIHMRVVKTKLFATSPSGLVLLTS